MKKEIDSINLILENSTKPVTCIIGGSKISSKIEVINNLIKKVDNLIIVGAMANNFLDFNGYNIGVSLIEKNTKEIIKEINKNAREQNCEVIIPQDCKVGLKFSGKGRFKKLNEIQGNEMILDVEKNYRNYLQ